MSKPRTRFQRMALACRLAEAIQQWPRHPAAEELAGYIVIVLSAPAGQVTAAYQGMEDVLDRVTGVKHLCSVCSKRVGTTYFKNETTGQRRHVYCSSTVTEKDQQLVRGS